MLALSVHMMTLLLASDISSQSVLLLLRSHVHCLLLCSGYGTGLLGRGLAGLSSRCAQLHDDHPLTACEWRHMRLAH